MENVVNCANSIEVSQLYQKVGKLALRKAMLLVRSEEVAQEIVHDIFEKLWREGRTFSNEKAAYLYIYKVCHSRGIDHLRTQKRRPQIELSTVSLSKDDFGKIANRDRIEKALKLLSKDDAALFFYSVIDEMTQAEIADLLEVSIKTVSRRLDKISDKLKGAIEYDISAIPSS